jgi:hypothetical protein
MALVRGFLAYKNRHPSGDGILFDYAVTGPADVTGVSGVVGVSTTGVISGATIGVDVGVGVDVVSSDMRVFLLCSTHILRQGSIKKLRPSVDIRPIIHCGIYPQTSQWHNASFFKLIELIKYKKTSQFR